MLDDWHCCLFRIGCMREQVSKVVRLKQNIINMQARELVLKRQPRQLATHILFKLEGLVHLARKPVNEETPFTIHPACARL